MKEGCVLFVLERWKKKQTKNDSVSNRTVWSLADIFVVLASVTRKLLIVACVGLVDLKDLRYT